MTEIGERGMIIKTARQIQQLHARGYRLLNTERRARGVGYRITIAGIKDVFDAFDLSHVIVRALRKEIWAPSSSEKILDDVAAAAILLVYISIPETARRLAKRRDVFDEFDAARRLGADEDTLLEILKPIKRGRDQ